ncbi:hypothetical protein HY407_01025 [Candidatus Gottesmanbacteria bacterium]|nr:hypothetical protein [Candidatus Gottesmanbacteria bacterium]
MEKIKPASNITRRRFLELSVLGLASPLLGGLGNIYKPSPPPVIPTSSATNEPTLTPINTATHTAVPSSTALPEATPDLEPQASATTKVSKSEWKFSDPEIIKSHLRNPNFFISPLGSSKRKLIAAQLDPKQYGRLRNREDLNRIALNACGSAVIAMVDKIYHYFNSGEVPDITVADVFNKLYGKKFHDSYGKTAPYIKPDYTLKASGVKPALDIISGNKYTASYITPDWGVIGGGHIVPHDQWADIFQTAKKEVFDKGGVVLLEGLKYGSRPGTAAHFVLATAAEFPDVLIVDPWGSSKRGDSKVTTLDTFFERADPTLYPRLKNQVGFMAAVGIVPNFISA